MSGPNLICIVFYDIDMNALNRLEWAASVSVNQNAVANHDYNCALFHARHSFPFCFSLLKENHYLVTAIITSKPLSKRLPYSLRASLSKPSLSSVIRLHRHLHPLLDSLLRSVRPTPVSTIVLQTGASRASPLRIPTDHSLRRAWQSDPSQGRCLKGLSHGTAG